VLAEVDAPEKLPASSRADAARFFATENTENTKGRFAAKMIYPQS
jgi:hypothetical protein